MGQAPLLNAHGITDVWERAWLACDFCSCQAGEIFGKTCRNQGLNPGESVSPDSFFPFFRPAVAELTNRGDGKACLMKTKTSLTKNSMNHSFRHCGGVSGWSVRWRLSGLRFCPRFARWTHHRTEV